jgi:lipooligosaccharide transport system ATP-binding protein
MTAVISTQGLTKTYGSFEAVKGVTFAVEEGSFCGLLGPNGAGKSTTMRMIYQVTPPTSGSLRVFGLETGREARRIKSLMGVVPQIDNLDEELSVEDNLRIYARYNGISGNRAERRTGEMLEFAELGSKRKALVNDLSGGMKRRLTLARGLMNDPQLLILDEPTTGLDPQVRLTLWEKLDELRARGITLLMSTHYLDEAERLCDTLLIMDHGAIIAQGSPRALIRQHLEPQVLEVRLRQGNLAVFERIAERAGSEVIRSGERASLFTADGAALLEQLGNEGFDQESAFLRPSNLEDLFLRLTGRSLRE